MACEQWEVLLAGEVYGDNSPADHKAVVDHLQTCEECREVMSGLSQAVKEIPNPSLPQGDEFWIRQKTSILAHLPDRQRTSPWAWPRLAGPVLALSVLMSVWGVHERAVKKEMRIAQSMDLLQDMDMVQHLDLMQYLEALEAQ